MGQKINPNILRLSKTDNWNSKYAEKKSTEFYLYSSKDLEVKKFITTFFKKNGLDVHTCKLNYFNNNLNIFLCYKQNFNSTILVDNINKAQKITLNKKHPTVDAQRNKNTNVIKTVKNLYNYELLAKSRLLQKQPKKRRVKIIRYYKKFLSLKQNKTIRNLILNSFLKKFFESLNFFFDKLNNVNLILKPLDTNVRKIMKKRRLLTIKKKLIGLKKYQRNDFFKEGVNLVFLSVLNRNSSGLLAKYISDTLKKLKKHNFFLRFLTAVLTMFLKRKFSVVKGVKIKIKGRVNGVPRAKRKLIRIGKRMRMPVLRINSAINYAESTAFTANGTLGVKVWVHERLRFRERNV